MIRKYQSFKGQSGQLTIFFINHCYYFVWHSHIIKCTIIPMPSEATPPHNPHFHSNISKNTILSRLYSIYNMIMITSHYIFTFIVVAPNILIWSFGMTSNLLSVQFNFAFSLRWPLWVSLFFLEFHIRGFIESSLSCRCL